MTEPNTDTLNETTACTLPINSNKSISRSNSLHSLSNGNVDKKVQNGAPPLISREDLILVPDPDQNYNGNSNIKIEGVSFYNIILFGFTKNILSLYVIHLYVVSTYPVSNFNFENKCYFL